MAYDVNWNAICIAEHKWQNVMKTERFTDIGRVMIDFGRPESH